MNILETIKKEQVLTGVALDVYEIVTNDQGSTVGEIAKKYQAMRPRFKRGRNEIAKRVRDLEVWGAIKKNGTAPCSVTGKTVATYKTTGNLPNRHAIPAMDVKAAEGAKLKAVDVAALLETKNDEIKKVKALAADVALEALKLNNRVTDLVKTVDGGVAEIATLRAVRAEKLAKALGFFTTKKTRDALKKEIEAIDFVLRTLATTEEFKVSA